VRHDARSTAAAGVGPLAALRRVARAFSCWPPTPSASRMTGVWAGAAHVRRNISAVWRLILTARAASALAPVGDPSAASTQTATPDELRQRERRRPSRRTPRAAFSPWTPASPARTRPVPAAYLRQPTQLGLGGRRTVSHLPRHDPPGHVAASARSVTRHRRWGRGAAGADHTTSASPLLHLPGARGPVHGPGHPLRRGSPLGPPPPPPLLERAMSSPAGGHARDLASTSLAG
jgi:hypothetical protein